MGMALRLGGGGLYSISFNSMNAAISKKLSKTAPEWRSIGEGLNFMKNAQI